MALRSASVHGMHPSQLYLTHIPSDVHPSLNAPASMPWVGNSPPQMSIAAPVVLGEMVPMGPPPVPPMLTQMSPPPTRAERSPFMKMLARAGLAGAASVGLGFLFDRIANRPTVLFLVGAGISIGLELSGREKV